MAKAKEELLTGVVQVDTDFRPNVPADQLVHLGKINTTVELIASYKITSPQAKLEVFRIVRLAATRISELEVGYKDQKGRAHLAHATICAHETEDKADWLIIRKFGLAAMEVWDREQERIAKVEADRVAREAEQARQKAEAEARRIQKEADDRAAELRRQGEMRAAREVVAQATEQAQEVVTVADSLADLGVIAPSAPKIGGLGEARPWIGVVEDVKKALAAIADGTVVLSTDDMDRLTVTLKPMATAIAKRLQKADIGWPGCKGERDFTYRVSKSTPAPYAPQKQEDGW